MNDTQRLLALEEIRILKADYFLHTAARSGRRIPILNSCEIDDTIELAVVVDTKRGLMMSEVRELEQAVTELSEHQLSEFRQWFVEFDADAWDEQLEADAAVGKLNALAEEAIGDYRSGRSREL